MSIKLLFVQHWRVALGMLALVASIWISLLAASAGLIHLSGGVYLP